MPQVAALGYAYFAGSAITASMVTAAVVEVALVAASVAYSASQQSKMKNALKNLSGLNDQGRDVMVRDPIADQRLIYGQILTSGNIVFMGAAGAKNEQMHILVAIAGHEVHDITGCVLDGNIHITLNPDGTATGGHTGKLVLTHFLGTDDQAADSWMTSTFPGIWTSAHRLRGIAYLHAMFVYDPELYSSGLPTARVLVSGKKVYDPRDEDQDPDDKSTWVYSNNAALCVADYLHDAKFGKAIPWSRIDMDALAEAANICDEDVLLGTIPGTSIVAGHTYTIVTPGTIDWTDYGAADSASGTSFVATGVPASGTGTVTTGEQGTEKRYTINGSILSSQDPTSVLQDMVNAMAGCIVDAGGIWTIRAGAYRAPDLTLGDDDLAGTFAVQPRQSRRESYNGVKGVYISPQNSWSPADFPSIASSTYKAQDGGVRLWKDVTYPFTMSSATAQRLASIDLERGRRQKIVTAPYNLKAVQTMPADTVLLNRPSLGWSDKEFEVLEWTLKQSGDESGGLTLAVDMTMRETDSDLWDWLGENETVIDPVTPSSFGGGSGLTNPVSPDFPDEFGDLWPPGILIPPSATITADCKTRGGTASLIGFSEYVSPSTPPKKYRRKQNSGTSIANRYSDGTCTTVDYVITCTHDGWCEYDKDTGTLSSGGADICNGSTQGTGCTAVTADCGRSVAFDQTTATASPISDCCSVSGGQTKATSDTLVQTLSVEDTEEDALARLEASLPAWADVTWSTCESVSAYWETRTGAVFTFDKVDAKMRFTGTAYYPGWDFTLTVEFERRLLPSDPWEDADIIEYSVPSDSGGAFEYVIDIPSDQGYETRVKQWTFGI